MKIKKIGGLLLIILTLTGCSQQAIIAEEGKEVFQIEEGAAHLEETENRSVATVDVRELTDFFKVYFSLSQERRLILNQNPLGLEKEDLKEYETELTDFKKELEPYLGKTLQKNWTRGLLEEAFHLPKLLEMNQYITIGETEVEEVVICSARPFGENIIYEVEVITKERVISSLEANEKYRWDKQTGYYRLKAEGEKSKEEVFESAYNLKEELKDSYLFLQEADEEETDEIRIAHRYWVEVKDEKKLQIESLNEASLIGTTGSYQKKASSNQHIRRMTYNHPKEEVYQERVLEVVRTILSQPKAFFISYEEVLEAGYEKVIQALEEMGLSDQIVVPKDSYKNAYGAHINPYKNNLRQLEVVKSEQIKLTNSLFGTLKQPRYNVQVRMKGRDGDNNEKYYTYEYLVGLEEEKVEFIHFVAAKEISLEQYQALSIE